MWPISCGINYNKKQNKLLFTDDEKIILFKNGCHICVVKGLIQPVSPAVIILAVTADVLL